MKKKILEKTKENKKKDNSLFSYYGFTKKDAKNYPVITKILKELTPERIKKEIETIQKVKLPPELQKWVKEYEKVGERDEFIWKWTYLGFKKVTLPTILKKYEKIVLITKFSSIVLNVLLDDLADKRKNKILIETAINMCFQQENFQRRYSLRSFSKADQEYLNLIKKTWFFLNRALKNFPRYKEFKDIFLYDYEQFFNAIKYGYLVNKNLNLINLTEYQIYFSHSMQGMISGTIDLMVLPTFNINEFGPLRELLWRAQRMGRLGNSLTTWKREIFENDFTSEIFAYTIMKGILTQKDLRKKDNKEIIKKIEKSNIENYFLKEWERCYKEIEDIGKKINSFNFKEVLKGLEDFFLMHLCSTGFK